MVLGPLMPPEPLLTDGDNEAQRNAGLEHRIWMGGNPAVPTSAPDEDLRPGTNWRGIPRGHSQLTWRLDFPEAT